jgi:hypothetical protein
MDRKSLVLVGITLILLSLFSLVLTGVTSLLGFNPGLLFLRMWPLVVVGIGLAFVLPPFLVRGKRGLGALLIPGFPILMTGTILLVGSVLNAWGIWAWLWPMELLALASGFLFAAIYMQLIWLVIPAIIVGLNALSFQFCAITGLWHWWSVLWVIEPLSVGLALLAVNIKVRSRGLSIAGLVLCGLAGLGFMLMITVLGAWWPVGLVGPVVLLLMGTVLLAWGMARYLLLPRSALE